MDDLYGRTGLAGRAGLSRLEELLNSGQVRPHEASSMLETMRGQSNLSSFLPTPTPPRPGMLPTPAAPSAPTNAPAGGMPGHGTILTKIMAQLMGGNEQADPQYQAGRALGELLRHRRG